MSLTGQNKTTSSTLVATSKTPTTILGLKKSGSGWDYDQSDISYDMDMNHNGQKVYYDSLGTGTTLTGLNKTNV